LDPAIAAFSIGYPGICVPHDRVGVQLAVNEWHPSAGGCWE